MVEVRRGSINQGRCNVSGYRLASGVCLLLTMGVLINLFGLQGGRQASEPAAAAAPRPPGANGGQVSQRTPAPSAPTDIAGLLVDNADADLSARTADVATSLSHDLPAEATEATAADAKLVTALQRELAAHGYDPGKLNGKAGVVTRAAILAFQSDQRLPLTAEPSEELLRQIILGLPGASDGRKSEPGPKALRLIAGTQRLMKQLGYYAGPINGRLDDVTRKSLRRFETDSGFVPRGRVSGEVLSELARQAKATIGGGGEALN